VKRLAALLLAASLPATAHAQAAGGSPPAPVPFPIVEQPPPPHRRHALAYVSMAAGAGLVAWSFQLTDRANRTYDRYLETTDEREIDRLYDRTISYDRWARVTLLGGEGLVATGLYFRFVQRPRGWKASLHVTPSQCALALRF